MRIVEDFIADRQKDCPGPFDRVGRFTGGIEGELFHPGMIAVENIGGLKVRF